MRFVTHLAPHRMSIISRNIVHSLQGELQSYWKKEYPLLVYLVDQLQ